MKVEKPKKEEMVASDPIQAVISSTKPQDNFWEITDLPSKFKLYAPGTKILARPLKVLEIKMLSTLNTDNINFVLNDIIGRCVTGIRVEDICTADKLYIIFWLRANTYRDSSYSIDFVCPDCKAKGKYDFQLDCLKINYLKDSFDENKDINLPSGKVVKIKMLRISDEIRVTNFEKTNAQSLASFDTDLLHAASLISEIDGKRIGLIAAYDFISKATPDDYSYIISYVNHYDFGIDPSIDAPCKKCGGAAQIAVTFRPEFFVSKYTFE